MLFGDDVKPVLIGIAKLAQQGPVLEEKARVRYAELPTRNYLTRCSGDRVPFHWTINPYRGCEFGCKYCYARYTHEFMELRESEQFENQIFAKQWRPLAFAKELRRVPRGQHIAIGTATDPYQPAERRYGITRRMLNLLSNESGLRVSITTKSDLIARDAELLALIAKRHILYVHMTVTTLDAGLARLLEPRAPRPDLRLGAVKTLSELGIHVGVFSSPVLPGLNDQQESLDRIAREAKRHGAVSFGASPVFLKPCAAKVFLPFLDREFPHLAADYQRTFGKAAFLAEGYKNELSSRVAKARESVGLERRALEYVPEEWGFQAQRSLFADDDVLPVPGELKALDVWDSATGSSRSGAARLATMEPLVPAPQC